jgi:hypothetical protein
MASFAALRRPLRAQHAARSHQALNDAPENENGNPCLAKVPVLSDGIRRHSRSARFDVLGARTLGALALRERHSLTLLEVFETDAFNG